MCGCGCLCGCVSVGVCVSEWVGVEVFVCVHVCLTELVISLTPLTHSMYSTHVEPSQCVCCLYVLVLLHFVS